MLWAPIIHNRSLILAMHSLTPRRNQRYGVEPADEWLGSGLSWFALQGNTDNLVGQNDASQPWQPQNFKWEVSFSGPRHHSIGVDPSGGVIPG
jgi:hypothetical protein